MILSVQAASKPKYLSFELSQLVPKNWIRFQPLEQTQFKSFNQVIQKIPSIQQGQQRQQLGDLFQKHTFHLEAEHYFLLILSMDLACVSKEMVLTRFETAHKRKEVKNNLTRKMWPCSLRACEPDNNLNGVMLMLHGKWTNGTPQTSSRTNQMLIIIDIYM